MKKKLINLWVALKEVFIKAKNEAPKDIKDYLSGGVSTGKHPFGIIDGGEFVVRMAKPKEMKSVCPNCMGGAVGILNAAYDKGLVTKEQMNLDTVMKLAGEMHEQNFYGMAKHLGGIEVLKMMIEAHAENEDFETCKEIQDSIDKYLAEVK